MFPIPVHVLLSLLLYQPFLSIRSFPCWRSWDPSSWPLLRSGRTQLRLKYLPIEIFWIWIPTNRNYVILPATPKRNALALYRNFRWSSGSAVWVWESFIMNSIKLQIKLFQPGFTDLALFAIFFETGTLYGFETFRGVCKFHSHEIEVSAWIKR